MKKSKDWMKPVYPAVAPFDSFNICINAAIISEIRKFQDKPISKTSLAAPKVQDARIFI